MNQVPEAFTLDDVEDVHVLNDEVQQVLSNASCLGWDGLYLLMA